MSLSPTAQRMMESLPVFYWDNVIIQRILQARANEIDRMDAMIDTLKLGVIPGAGDDTLRLLAVWETILGLPVAPDGVTVEQRQSAIRAQLQALDAVTAADVLALLTAQLGAAFTIERDTPALLEDAITLYTPEGSYTTGTVQRTAAKVWPAHRQLNVHYAAGFVLDTSFLDEDTL